MKSEPHFVDKMTAEAKRLAAEAGITLPELMHQMQAEESAFRDCWNCATAISMGNGSSSCPHCE